MSAGVLAALSAGGVYLAAAGAGSPSHCGPCLTCPHADARAADLRDDCCPSGACCPTGACCPGDTVTEVVDVNAVLAAPRPNPVAVPFVSFDEPPLAKPARPAADVGVVQASFIAPIVDADDRPAVEVAPLPRAAGGGLPLSGPTSPF